MICANLDLRGQRGRCSIPNAKFTPDARTRRKDQGNKLYWVLTGTVSGCIFSYRVFHNRKTKLWKDEEG